MTWTAYGRPRQPEDDTPAWAVILVLVLLAGMVVSGRACYGQAAYGDWTCGFKRCVEVTK